MSRVIPSATWSEGSKGLLVGNEAGMCLGINGLTNCAPIADWAGEGNWVAHTWRCLPCVRPGAGRRGSPHIAKSAMYAPPDHVAKGDVRRPKSKFTKRTWNVPWNQQFHFLASCFTMQIGRAG